jgi:hypothetical protein
VGVVSSRLSSGTVDAVEEEHTVFHPGRTWLSLYTVDTNIKRGRTWLSLYTVDTNIKRGRTWLSLYTVDTNIKRELASGFEAYSFSEKGEV